LKAKVTQYGNPSAFPVGRKRKRTFVHSYIRGGEKIELCRRKKRTNTILSRGGKALAERGKKIILNT